MCVAAVGVCGLLSSAVRSPSPLPLIESRQNEEDIRRACLSTSATCTGSHSTQGGARRPILEPLSKAAFQITPLLILVFSNMRFTTVYREEYMGFLLLNHNCRVKIPWQFHLLTVQVGTVSNHCRDHVGQILFSHGKKT